MFDLGLHLQAVLLAGGLDDPGQHQLPEHLVPPVSSSSNPSWLWAAHGAAHNGAIREDTICNGPDPSGQVRSDIVDWWADGFFPLPASW
jgi:hypothetical protein